MFLRTLQQAETQEVAPPPRSQRPTSLCPCVSNIVLLDLGHRWQWRSSPSIIAATSERTVLSCERTGGLSFVSTWPINHDSWSTIANICHSRTFRLPRSEFLGVGRTGRVPVPQISARLISKSDVGDMGDGIGIALCECRSRNARSSRALVIRWCRVGAGERLNPVLVPIHRDREPRRCHNSRGMRSGWRALVTQVP